MLHIPQTPTGYPLSALYTVFADGQNVPVRRCRVSAYPLNQVWPGYQRPLYQTEEAAFASFDFNGEVTLRVVPARPFSCVVIKPLSRGVVPTVQDGVITFTLRQAGPYTVELDGFHHALHLFAAAPKSYDLGDNTLYFGPGIHDVGLLDLEDDQTVYIDDGAVVYGAIRAFEKKNVRILGRGILDNSRLERYDDFKMYGDPSDIYSKVPTSSSIFFDRCENVMVSGPICVDASTWSIKTFGCTHVRIEDVKLIGFWRYNSDGIDFCNSQDVELRDSFLRCFDDCIVVKGNKACDIQPAENIRISHCVVWCDWGCALELGADTVADSFSNISFQDIDIIRTFGVAIGIQSSDRADIHNIAYEDIRVECDAQGALAPVYQSDPNMVYENPNPNHLPWLLWSCIMHHDRYSSDSKRGKIHDILYRNISVTAPAMPPSSFSGFDEDHQTSDVRIENFTLNGKPVTTLEDTNVTIGDYASDIVII